jgi:L-threonylcarbamoyladenylate synthase
LFRIMARLLPFTADNWEAVVPPVRERLDRHGLIALPTETFYGLAVRPMDQEALHRLHEAKGRPTDKPILLLIGHPDQLGPLVSAIPPAASLLMARFWPGPLTLVIPAAKGLSPRLTAGTGTIGVRLPPLPHLRALLQVVGPLTGTSANRSSEPALDTAAAVDCSLGDDLDLILDGGRTAGGAVSTIVDTRSPLRLLRPGAVDIEMLRTALGEGGYTLSS